MEREGAEALLASRPELADDLEALVAVERDREGPWTFAEVPVDSGAFGELVDRGVVERRGDGAYRLADPAAARAALDGDPPGSGAPSAEERRATSSAGGGVPGRARVRAAVADGGSAAALLAAVLAVHALVRVVPAYRRVFRGEDVVVGGNDPYYYRYWLDRLLASDLPALSPGALARLPGELPTHDVLTTVCLWWLAALAGGDPRAAGLVLAWYPVAAGGVTVVGTYAVAARALDDRRVGLAAAATLATVPVHAGRTALGFGDHHAADLLLLVCAVYGLVRVLDGDPGEAPLRTVRERWPGVALLGLAVAGQVAAWRAGPLFVLPLGLVAVAVVLSAWRTDRSVPAAAAPLVAATALAAAATLALHAGLGWLPPHRAYAPGLLAAGVAGVAGSAAVLRGRVGTRGLVGTWTVLGVGGGLLVWAVAPALPAAVGDLVAALAEFRSQGIVETRPLFAPEQGLVVAPVFVVGLAGFVSVPYLCWATARVARGTRPRLLAVAVYAWWFLALAAVQVRFAAGWAPFVAVFAGLGLVHAVAVVDLGRPPAALVPDGPGEGGGRDTGGGRALAAVRSVDAETAVGVAVLFLLVNGLGLALAPGVVADQTVDDQTYRTALAAGSYAADHDLSYPESYVFSPWPRNRVYNYYASGESKEYGYALVEYGAFQRARSAPAWYDRLGDRAGFVVVEPAAGYEPATLQHRLSRTDGDPGLAHYRLVHVEPDSRALYALVPGARLVGSAPPDATVTATAAPTVSGVVVDYRRSAAADADGRFAVTVAHPGSYRVGNRTVVVDERAVTDGSRVRVGSVGRTGNDSRA